MKPEKQIMIASLRKGLKGTLSSKQLKLMNLLNITNVTYEHAHKNKNSSGMLKRIIGMS